MSETLPFTECRSTASTQIHLMRPGIKTSVGISAFCIHASLNFAACLVLVPLRCWPALLRFPPRLDDWDVDEDIAAHLGLA